MKPQLSRSVITQFDGYQYIMKFVMIEGMQYITTPKTYHDNKNFITIGQILFHFREQLL